VKSDEIQRKFNHDGDEDNDDAKGFYCDPCEKTYYDTDYCPQHGS
jgi:hypothetical protein